MEQLTAEQLLQSIWAALRRIEDNLALPPAPLELPPINVTPPDLTEVVTAVTSLRPSATADDIARALADVLSPGTDGDTSDALRQVAEGLKTLDHRLQGFGKQAYGGGSAIIDKASVAAAGLAKETTLQAVADTLYRRTDALPAGGNTIGRVDVNAVAYTVVSAEVSVAAGASFVTVVADTPGSDLTLVGYNAEISSLLEARVRLRLITGTDVDPTVLHVETVTTGANGWQPLHLSVPAGTRVAVQAVHGEITAQVTRGSLNWSNP